MYSRCDGVIHSCSRDLFTWCILPSEYALFSLICDLLVRPSVCFGPVLLLDLCSSMFDVQCSVFNVLLIEGEPFILVESLI